MQNREATVAVVSESTEQRLEVVLREGARKPIVIRKLSFSASVGWYTQQEIELTRSEFAGLRNVMGLKVPPACAQAVAAATSVTDDREALISFVDARIRLA